MDRLLALLVLCLSLSPSLSVTTTPGYIVPSLGSMLDSKGNPDYISIISNMITLGQLVESLRTEMRVLQSQMASTTQEIHFQEKNYNSTKDEITAMKQEMTLSQNNVASLQSALQHLPDPLEFNQLKQNVSMLKSSLSSNPKINATVVDHIGKDVKSNIRNIGTLKQDLSAVNALVNLTTSGLAADKKVMANLKSQIGTLQQNFNTTETLFQINYATIKDLENKLKTLDTRLTTGLSHLDANMTSKLNALQSTTATTSKDLKSTTGLVQLVIGDVAKLDAKVNNLTRLWKNGHANSLQTLANTTSLAQSTANKLDTVAAQVANLSGVCASVQAHLNKTDTGLAGTTSLAHSIANKLNTVEAQVTNMSGVCVSVQANLNKTDTGLAITTSLAQFTANKLNTVEAQMTNLSGVCVAVQSSLKRTNTDLVATTSLAQLAVTNLGGLQFQLDNVSNWVKDVAQELAQVSNKLDKTKVDVAFYVLQKERLKSGWTNFAFDTLSFNVGGGYKNSTGVFTAPVAGTYLFWANVEFNGESYYEIFIYKGNQKLARGYTETKTPSSGIKYGVASTMAVTHLAVGDHVYFSSDSTTDTVEGEGESSYGGALLRVT